VPTISLKKGPYGPFFLYASPLSIYPKLLEETFHEHSSY
jgi:hypothetical protein